MFNLDVLRREWEGLSTYERFEQIVTRLIQVLVSVVIVYAIILVAVELVRDFQLGTDFMEKEVLQDIFGSILTVLILLEFNHSIAIALTRRSGVLQVRTVILIAVLVIMRKLILLDYKTTSVALLGALGLLALCLGALYWLTGHAESRKSDHHEPGEVR